MRCWTWRINGLDPRPHARGDSISCRRSTISRSFDPRPHARGDNVRTRKESDDRVSIHAPTRGATSGCHRPSHRRSCFDPRPHARGDGPDAVDYRLEEVSIHAPTRGATPGLDGDAGHQRFRSTPPREGRLPYRNLLIFRQKSTSRREACKQSKFLPSG